MPRTPPIKIVKKTATSKKTALFGNSSYGVTLPPEVMVAKKLQIAQAVASILEAVGVDYKTDHNTADTPNRVAKMLCEESLSGMFSPPPRLTFFKNAKKFDQLINVGPIDVRSMCAHHMQSITGIAMISVLPSKDGKIIGLSKYHRVVDYFSRRFQIQEELVSQIADFLEANLEPQGIAVRIIAKHGCVGMRGVKQHNSLMDTTVARGLLRTDINLKTEFLDSCRIMVSGVTNL